MSASVRFVSYKGKRGFVVRGGPEVQPTRQDSHMGRSFYLVSRLEAANWGTVQNYDGAGMSAGPLHVIAYLPASGDPGPLWRMVRKIFDASSAPAVGFLRRKLDSLGWSVDERGVVRDSSGTAVRGSVIREQLSAPDGRVPESGPVHDRAKNWALLFHGAFADPSSYPAQYEGTVDWLLGNFDAEADAYRKYVPGLTGSDADVKRWVRGATMAQVGPYLDLAMSIYHAFSANAPGVAKRVLNSVLARNLNVRDFAKALPKALEDSGYKNWDVRARKTKSAVARSGLWPEEVVEYVYPDAQAASMRVYVDEVADAVSEAATDAAGSVLPVLLLGGSAGALLWYMHKRRAGKRKSGGGLRRSR